MVNLIIVINYIVATMLLKEPQTIGSRCSNRLLKYYTLLLALFNLRNVIVWQIFNFLACYLLYFTLAFALDPKQQANDLANSLQQKTNQNIMNQDLSGIIPNFTRTPDEINLDKDNLNGAASQIFDKSDLKSMAINSVERRNAMDLKKQDLLNLERKLLELDFIKGEYKACSKLPDNNIKTQQLVNCDEAINVETKICNKKRELKIDSKYLYQCNKERQYTNKSCNKTLQIICKQNTECDSGGIVLTSINSDVAWRYNYPQLVVGTIADNYWGGNCALYERNVKFEIKNKDAITNFRLTGVGFDDHMQINLNGQTIYVGPYGGTGIALVTVPSKGFISTRTYVNNGFDNFSCELATSWYFAQNIDLKPYLLDGENILNFKVIVSGAGEGWMRIDARQQCCNEYDEIWSEDCP